MLKIFLIIKSKSSTQMDGGREFTSSIFKKYPCYMESLINSLALTCQNKMVYLNASTGIL